MVTPAVAALRSLGLAGSAGKSSPQSAGTGVEHARLDGADSPEGPPAEHFESAHARTRHGPRPGLAKRPGLPGDDRGRGPALRPARYPDAAGPGDVPGDDDRRVRPGAGGAAAGAVAP